MKRLLVLLAAAALVLVPTAFGRALAGPTPFHAVTPAPDGLHAFLLRPDETPLKYYPRTPSFAWNPVDAKGGSYEFELSTTRSFNEAGVLFNYKNLKIPALSIAHQLPWMTGLPYSLWAHVRWISADGKTVTPWSEAFGFNMRWSDDDYPQQLTAPEGLIRWKPIEGATRYEVLFPDISPPFAFQTTTNVADEREFFSFKWSTSIWSTVHWRVRAIRYIDDKDVLKNGLPRVSYGPWSKTFTTVNPPLSLGVLTPTDTVSDEWDKKGQPAKPHELTPGFAWTPSTPVLGQFGSFGSALYRVYVFTDDHCVNQVFQGSVVGSPAFAPRVTGGPMGLPQSSKLLGGWMFPPYTVVGQTPDEGHSYDATGKIAKPNELPGKGQPTNGNTVPDANGVDLWDSGWPNGRYYWTVVPVTIDWFPPFDPASTDPPVEYHDTAVPQDQCEAGLGMSFGKVSQPVVTQGATPWVSGLTPDGRVVASASRVPVVHDSPLVAWQPAVGATTYDVELSKRQYPWKPTWSTSTPATSIVLPLARAQVGTWWYRVRGVNPALPVGAQAMSWSKPVRIRVTGDSFVILKKKK
jgi:hypothetical protein